MKTFDLQGVEIDARRDVVFDFVSDPENLPKWTRAFESASRERARLATPEGAVDVRLRTTADRASGVVDWRMEFPDGSVALAQSRVTETTRATTIYSFVLHAPPVPLERVEGALEAQSATLRDELSRLKTLLERR